MREEAGSRPGPRDTADRPGDLAGVDLESVREALVAWYETDHRSLPWRETDDPYAILVAEVMSQQTQLGRVAATLPAFLDEWPTVDALAAADRSAVLEFWTDQRLGYNNRARYLHEAASQIVTGAIEGVPAGEVPREPDRLSELQGVGAYTANAVASLAFNNGDAVVDTNVKRVLHRAFDVEDDDAAFERTAAALLPAGESRVWNNAIMELGGVACTQTPRCDEAECPWRRWCGAYRTGDFTAPDVPEQPAFEGSRRQFRGRVVRTLATHGPLEIDDLGPRVRVEYDGDGAVGREWLRDLLADLAADGLVTVDESGGEPVVALQD